MRVMIGNGSTLDCDTKCSSVPVTIQGHTFSVDLYTLPIRGANIVLGVQLLKLPGPVTTDYFLLTMTFTYMGQFHYARMCLSSRAQHQPNNLNNLPRLTVFPLYFS